MSLYTLADVLDFVRDFIPGVPQAKVVRNLNLALDEIMGEVAQVEWSTFTTKADASGTASVTNNSTAVTALSGSPLVFPDTGGLHFVQFGGAATWYPVTPTSTSAGTLASAYEGDTDAAATFRLVFPTVALPAGVGQVLCVSRGGERLDFATKENARVREDAQMVGLPRWWGPYVSSALTTPDDAHRIVLTPFPDDVYSFEYAFTQRTGRISTTATAATTKLPLPQLFDQAVIYKTLALCWGHEEGGLNFDKWEGKAAKAVLKARSTTSAQASGQRGGSRSPRRPWTAQDQYAAPQ